MTSYLQSFRNRETFEQIIRVGFVGGFNTFVYLILFNVFLGPYGSFWAITGAYTLATGLSYVLNRRWSFQVDDGSVGSARESMSFYVVNLVSWGITVGITGFADNAWGPLTRVESNLVQLLATGLVVLPKFAVYRDGVFKKSLEASDDVEARESLEASV